MITIAEANSLVDEVLKAHDSVSPNMKEVAGSYVESLRIFVLNDRVHARRELEALFAEIEKGRKRWKRKLTAKESAFVTACQALQDKLASQDNDLPRFGGL